MTEQFAARGNLHRTAKVRALAGSGSPASLRLESGWLMQPYRLHVLPFLRTRGKKRDRTTSHPKGNSHKLQNVSLIPFAWLCIRMRSMPIAARLSTSKLAKPSTPRKMISAAALGTRMTRLNADWTKMIVTLCRARWRSTSTSQG